MKKLVFVLAMVAILSEVALSQDLKIPLIGSKAPSFTAETTNGTITFPEDYGKKWKILFSHPQDFTPVCSTELSELAYAQKDFEKLGVQIAIISTDDVETHRRWKTWLESLNYEGHGAQVIKFPIIDDHSHIVSKQYGMIHEIASTNKDIRGVFIIDPNNNVRAINFYPMQIGRNFKEIERIVVALQTADKDMVCTPANWEVGKDVIIPRYPYTDSQLADNPTIKDDYYNVGGYIWFKKNIK